MKNEEGEWLEEEELEKAFLDYFLKIYASEGIREWNEPLEAVERVVTVEMNESLIADVTEEETKRVVFQMDALKAPGPKILEHSGAGCV